MEDFKCTWETAHSNECLTVGTHSSSHEYALYHVACDCNDMPVTHDGYVKWKNINLRIYFDRVHY